MTFLIVCSGVGVGCLGALPVRDGLPCSTDADCEGPDGYKLPCGQDGLCKAEACTTPSRECFTGNAGCTQGADGKYTCQGTCKAGTQECQNGFWSACQGQTTPISESCKENQSLCCDGLDNDCNGKPDDAFSTASICTVNTIQAGAGGLETCKEKKVSCTDGDMTFIQSANESFRMGSSKDVDTNRDPDEGIGDKDVLVKFTYNYGISKTEITRKQFKDVMGYLPTGNEGSDNLPVANVSWHEAAMYTVQRSQNEGFSACFSCLGSFAKGTPFTGTCLIADFGERQEYATSCNGYRLPTEAEWEYAYKGKKGTSVYSLYYNGDTLAKLKEIAWFQDNAGGGPRAVADPSLKPNDWGLSDMSGNVAEWMFDLYQANYSGANENWVGPRPGTNDDVNKERSFRGGHYDSLAKDCRGAARENAKANFRAPTLGFRVARTLLETSSK